MRIDTFKQDWRWLALLALLGVAALWTGWAGFIASDDSLYYQGANRWLIDPPFAGSDHWSTRFPLILVFAGALATIGRNFVAFAATALVGYVALVALMGAFAARIGGGRSGWIAAILTATLPVVIANATTVSVDLYEASFLLGGAMLLGDAGDDARGLRRGLAAGLCFGMAILCRETALLALVGLGPIFLIGKPVPRRVLIAAGMGLVVVLGGEALFQAALTGEPLRRYTIAFHHDEHIDRAANKEGNFLLHPAVDPFLVLLINDDFGLLFWLAGAALWLGALRTIDGGGRHRLWVLAAMGAASFALVAVLVHKLVLNPRYFLIPALVAVTVVAIWLDRLAPRWRMLLIATIVSSNLLLLSVGNAHPRWAMEALVDAAKAYPNETISGDPVDVRRAHVPMAFAGLDNTRYAPAAPGTLLVAPEENAPAGDILRRYPSPPTRLGGLIEATGLKPLVPSALAHRMFAPSPAVVLVRTPPSG
ncbi:hypothetical protein BH09PSE4_BH09PSE4_16720 [soil metagenome]